MAGWRERLNQPVFAKRVPAPEPELRMPPAAPTLPPPPPVPPAPRAVVGPRAVVAQPAVTDDPMARLEQLALAAPPLPAQPVDDVAEQRRREAEAEDRAAELHAERVRVDSLDLADRLAVMAERAAGQPALDTLTAEDEQRAAAARERQAAERAASLREESLDVADRLAVLAQRAEEHRPAMERAHQAAQQAEAQLAADRARADAERAESLRAESLDIADRLAERLAAPAAPVWDALPPPPPPPAL